MKPRKLIGILFCLCVCTALRSTNYYINPAAGNDAKPGTSPVNAWQTLKPLEGIRFLPGDSILFASGQKISGMLSLQQVKGQAGKPVVIAAYPYKGNRNRPVLDAGEHLNALLIQNSSHIVVRGLEITGLIPVRDTALLRQKNIMRCGVRVEVTEDAVYEDILLEDLLVHDVFLHPPGYSRTAAETRTANGTEGYGWGIRFLNNSKQGQLNKIKVSKTTISQVDHTGLKITAANNGITGLTVAYCTIFQTGGPGLQISGVQDGYIHHNTIHHSGYTGDSRNWGRGSGMWTWGCRNILIEHNRFENANGPGDSAGVHIDYNCSDVVVQYNFSANNAGGFCEILGNNFNCAYRYNISVNDGFREKGVNGAFQEGKIFWLSGYQGNDKKRAGPYNSYFYNNSIYVGAGIVPKISISPSAAGVLVMNNIFYFEQPGRKVADDQKKQDADPEVPANVRFINNLFFRGDNWPADIAVKDAAPLTGDPGYQKKGGLQPADYIPSNKQLVGNKGMPVSALPNDTIGLRIGLTPAKDILGNPISGNPDMGAIEIKEK